MKPVLASVYFGSNWQGQCIHYPRTGITGVKVAKSPGGIINRNVRMSIHFRLHLGKFTPSHALILAIHLRPAYPGLEYVGTVLRRRLARVFVDGTWRFWPCDLLEIVEDRYDGCVCSRR
jgi:hypothetical protein